MDLGEYPSETGEYILQICHNFPENLHLFHRNSINIKKPIGHIEITWQYNNVSILGGK